MIVHANEVAEEEEMVVTHVVKVVTDRLNAQKKETEVVVEEDHVIAVGKQDILPENVRAEGIKFLKGPFQSCEVRRG